MDITNQSGPVTPQPVQEGTGSESPGLMNAISQAITGGDGAEKVLREPPKIEESRRRLVMQWQQEIRKDKEYFKDDWKRMREDEQYALYGADKDWISNDNYTVPIINRQINLTVAALYAKNPKAVAKRKKKLRFKQWDGKKETAMAAFQNVQMAAQQGLPADPMSSEILQEISEAKAYDQMLDRVGKTLELLFEYYTGECNPNFKQEMKQCVRRAKTCGVAYVELGFQRALEEDPEVVRALDDMTQQISLVETKLQDRIDAILARDDPETEETRSMIRDLQEAKMIIAREGLTFNFPKALNIIPHRACKQLRGFVGADYLTHEFDLTPEQIEQVYKVDVRQSYKAYKNGQPVTAGIETSGQEDNQMTDVERGTSDTSRTTNSRGGTARVWRVQSRRTGQVFTLVEGWPDFVEEPKAPELQVNGFYTIYPLTFNDVEHEKQIFPMSDVHYLKWPQKEYNNARQGKREHRVANRPKYFIRKGAMEETEKVAIKNAPAHSVLEMNALEGDVNQMIQAHKPVPIDPNLYDTTEIMRDVQMGVGTQEANLGPTSGATATESSIAEQSRGTTLASNVDDLDEFLSDIARACGQVMLTLIDESTAAKIAGSGAVWPQLDPQQITEEIFLEIKAGSSGRPNKAAELANMERGMPYLIQLGGVNGTVLAKRYADLLDMDEEELIVDGLPSVVALNAMAAKSAQVQPGTGDTATDPAAQGQQTDTGQNNAPGQSQNQNESGAQPAYPTSVQRFGPGGERIG
jgi:hypothetical protein